MTETTAPLANSINDWIARGVALADQRRAYDWALAEWMAEGKEAEYLTRVKFDFVSESIGLPTKRLKDLLKAAVHFPGDLRHTGLSVEHHAAIASLPSDEAQALLRRASNERLAVNALREHVTQRRYATGDNFKDEDVDSTLATQAIRAWNRATPEARELVFEHLKIAAANGHTVVDEDEPAHA